VVHARVVHVRVVHRSCRMRDVGNVRWSDDEYLRVWFLCEVAVKVIRKLIVVLLKNVDHFVVVKKNDAGEALPQFRVCCMQIQRTIGLESLGFGRSTEGVLFRRFVLQASRYPYV
jgi:hypothetical protein